MRTNACYGRLVFLLNKA